MIELLGPRQVRVLGGELQVEAPKKAEMLPFHELSGD